MRLRIAGFAFGLAALGALGPHSLASAAADSRGAQVVAKVGPVSITVLDLERRLRTIPRFQLATFGKSAAEVRRAFLEKVMIPDALYAAGAHDRKLDESPSVRDRVSDALRSARLASLHTEVLSGGALGPQEILRYYEENKSRFDSPERVTVWRILCKTKEEAQSVLEEAKKPGGPQRWNELAREHSIDKATAMRGGNLGFLSPDGSSNEAGVKADPAIVAAAKKVKDGELVSEPIVEPGGFAVVWRRGSLPPVHRSIEQETQSIRQILMRQKLEQGAKDLVKRLRETKLGEVNAALLDTLEIDSQGGVGPKKKPGIVPRKPAGKPAPVGSR